MNESNEHQKSGKTPFIIYADFESLIDKIDECKNNSNKSYTTKVNEYILSNFPMSAIYRMMYTEVKVSWTSFVNL